MNEIRRTPILTAFVLGLTLTVLALANCGGDESGPVDPGKDPIVGPDTIAPAVVADLRLRTPTQNSLALVWTAPGDDGAKGTATSYDIRFSKALIDGENWEQASPLDAGIVPSPKPAGQIETIVISHLESGQTYYFALKTSDEVPNQSDLSNSAHETTLAETHPPSNITDLKAEAVDDTSFVLTWTAPGDDYNTGTATRYDIRYGVRPVLTDGDWDRAVVVANPPAPKPAGEKETFVTSDPIGNNFFFVIKTADELDNWSGASNQALALGYGETFWAFPTWTQPGEHIYIAFRTTGSDLTRVSIHEYHYAFEDKSCGSKLITEIVHETLPEGTYTVVFDFVDPQTGEYLPSGSYQLFLCCGSDLIEYSTVYFN